MKKVFEGEFEFKGFHNCRSMCILRIAEIGESFVCMATEPPHNPGTSISNAAAELATQVSQTFELPMHRMIWIEHYGADYMKRFARSMEAQSFDLVVFQIVGARFCRPSWRPLQRKDIEEVLPLDFIKEIFGRS